MLVNCCIVSVGKLFRHIQAKGDFEQGVALLRGFDISKSNGSASYDPIGCRSRLNDLKQLLDLEWGPSGQGGFSGNGDVLSTSCKS